MIFNLDGRPAPPSAGQLKRQQLQEKLAVKNDQSILNIFFSVGHSFFF